MNRVNMQVSHKVPIKRFYQLYSTMARGLVDLSCDNNYGSMLLVVGFIIVFYDCIDFWILLRQNVFTPKSFWRKITFLTEKIFLRQERPENDFYANTLLGIEFPCRF